MQDNIAVSVHESDGSNRKVVHATSSIHRCGMSMPEGVVRKSRGLLLSSALAAHSQWTLGARSPSLLVYAYA